MADKDSVLAAVYAAIDEVNQDLPDDEQIPKALVTVLVGSGGLDSLVLVNLIGETEDKIEDEFDVSISLADESAMGQESSPFANIGSVVEYIVTLIEAEDD